MATKRGIKATPSRTKATKPKAESIAEEAEATTTTDEPDTDTASAEEAVQKAVEVLTETFGDLQPVDKSMLLDSIKAQVEFHDCFNLSQLDRYMDKGLPIDSSVVHVYAINNHHVMRVISSQEGVLEIMVHCSADANLAESVARLVWEFEVDESETVDPDTVTDWTQPWKAYLPTDVEGDDSY